MRAKSHPPFLQGGGLVANLEKLVHFPITKFFYSTNQSPSKTSQSTLCKTKRESLNWRLNPSSTPSPPKKGKKIKEKTINRHHFLNRSRLSSLWRKKTQGNGRIATFASRTFKGKCTFEKKEAFNAFQVTISCETEHSIIQLHVCSWKHAAEEMQRDTEESVLSGEPESAVCVRKFDDSLSSAIRKTYRSLLRSSSLWEPRYPLLRVVQGFILFLFRKDQSPSRGRADFS